MSRVLNTRRIVSCAFICIFCVNCPLIVSDWLSPGYYFPHASNDQSENFMDCGNATSSVSNLRNFSAWIVNLFLQEIEPRNGRSLFPRLQFDWRLGFYSTTFIHGVVWSFFFQRLSKSRQGMPATKKPTVGAQFKVSTVYLVDQNQNRSLLVHSLAGDFIISFKTVVDESAGYQKNYWIT